jgi:hypothetical protein
MKTLRVGAKGADVRRWQSFLVGQGFDPKGIDGKFGSDTEKATKAFQKSVGVAETGIVDNATLGAAATAGFQVVDDDPSLREGTGFPSIPVMKPLVGTTARADVFGKFAFVHEPKPDNEENIRITDDWAQKNIVAVDIPQLRGVTGAPSAGKVQFHRLAAGQLRTLWQAWEDAGLLDRVLTWHGTFVPRFVRGRIGVLSNHAFGSAFDINRKWNDLGHQPALLGEEGSVRELVQIANAHGFFWGGHFRNRQDGMHFEIAELKRG